MSIQRFIILTVLLICMYFTTVSTFPDCSAPPDAGLCRTRMKRFYYDVPSNSCKPFMYGGCGGNSNKFYSEEICRRHCPHVRTKSDCLLPQEVGTCKVGVPRFFFNVSSGKCEYFAYGGCGGNKNKFHKIESCRRLCHEEKPNLDCFLPPPNGRCSLAFTKRYFFDATIEKCRQFYYRSCKSNANNFESMANCRAVCP